MNPYPFTLRQLQYAKAVAETGGFRTAAERCHVSQPSLSAQLAELESQLGARLFERGRRGVLVTAAGQQLLERAGAVLTAAEDLLAAARRVADPFSGELKLGVIPTLSPYLLPLAVPKLRAAWPKLTLWWTEDKTARLASALRKGELDAIVVAKIAGLEDLEQRPLGEDAFVLAGPKAHALLKPRGPATATELRGEELLLLEEGHCFREQALAVCTRARTQVSDFRATSLATLARMAASGAGLTLLPELSLEVENRNGELGIRRFGSPQPSRTLVLAWRKASPLGEALTAIAKVLRSAAAR